MIEFWFNRLAEQLDEEATRREEACAIVRRNARPGDPTEVIPGLTVAATLRAIARCAASDGGVVMTAFLALLFYLRAWHRVLQVETESPIPRAWAVHR